VGSEAGMVRVAESEVVTKGRVGPGEIIGVDLAEARMYGDRELKDLLAAQRPYADWLKRTVELESLIRTGASEPVELDSEGLRRRQLGYGISMEDLELILQPMVE